jgi:hypothetical protein
VRYICALRNVKGPGGIPQLLSDDPVALEAFARKYDRSGWGVYDRVATLRADARRRTLETVAALSVIHIDIDTRMLTTPREPVLQKLLDLPLALEIRDSGGGFHVLALLKEEVESGTEEFERVNALRARLTKILCGDPAPDHAAALLRRPGTHNSKYGEPRECHVVRAGKPVDVTEVETLAELYEQPLFEFKPKANGHVPPSPPAGENTDAGPVDAGSRLAAMTFEGPGDSSIHRTQLSCTAPLLCRGRTVECAVDEVLDATRRAVTGNPECANWDWAEERWTIEKMCFDFVNKNRELCEVLPDKLRESWRERQDRATSTSRSCGAVTPINGASPVANRATEEAAYPTTKLSITTTKRSIAPRQT